MAGVNGLNALEQRPAIAQPSDILDALNIPFRLPPEWEECFGFRSDLRSCYLADLITTSMTPTYQQIAIVNRVIEWLDSVSITSSDKELNFGVI